MSTTLSSASPSATPLEAVPLLHELHLSKDAEDWLRTISPGMFQNYDSVQKVWNAPITQFSLTLMQDSEFKAAATQIGDSHQGGKFISYELVLILFFWIFRAWRLQKVGTWLLRIWTQAWVGFIFWVLSFTLVPYLVWGEAYLTVIKQLSKAILRHFFT